MVHNESNSTTYRSGSKIESGDFCTLDPHPRCLEGIAVGHLNRSYSAFKKATKSARFWSVKTNPR
ncbi:hypothetical protein BH18ACI4_BH18ACI4_10750 [soil metagenome]